MKIRLYQLSKDVYPHARFLPYSEALKAFRDDELPGAIYNLVFEGFVDCPDIEGVYTLFNVESEKYYKGHSLSVSDIVEVLNESYADEGKFYYVEPIGFKEISFDGKAANNKLEPVSKRLIRRIERELTEYQSSLMKASAEKIYDDAYKLVFMREIAYVFKAVVENEEYDNNLLFELDYPLEEIYESWLNTDYDLELPIKDTIRDFTNYVLPYIKKPAKIKVVICEPGKVARIAEIDNTLEAMQEIVGGYIETYPLDDLDEIVVICNEEGKIKNLPLNCIYKNGEIVEIIAGNFFICTANTNTEHFTGLTEKLANKYCEMFKCPEEFIVAETMENGIKVKEWPF